MQRLNRLLLIVLLAAAPPALAQVRDWPERPVRIIVPFAAGGNSDIIARTISQPLTEAFGRQFVIENRPGASGSLAAEAVIRSQADGYTLFMGTSTQIAILPVLGPIPYDPVKDFAPISIVGTTPYVLVVNAGLPVHTLGELVDYARKHPGELTYVVNGVGSVSQLGMALFLKRAGLQMTAVSYKGGAAPMADVLAGHVSMYFTNLSSAVPNAESGAVRLLAISAQKRAEQIPDVPTFAESDFPGFQLFTWNGLLAPAGTPPAIVDRLAQETIRALKNPSVIEHLRTEGVDALGNTPQEFAATITADIALWGEAIKDAAGPASAPPP
jgi:tripartite-type tricarboxylate transporter receptor subunit TctC